jgi:glycosyltransferase involved in cell wall biosynthesis
MVNSKGLQVLTNNARPQFSIIIPNYNMANFLPHAIESVLSQSFEDFELIIADNCSTDDSLEVINRYNDSRIKILKNVTNLGLFTNLNVAVAHAAGNFIHVLCADDEFYSETLEKINEAYVAFGQAKSEVYLFHQINIGKSKGENISEDLNSARIYRFDEILKIRRGLSEVCVSRKLLTKIGGFGPPNANAFSADWLWFGKCALEAEVIIGLNSKLVFERQHEGQNRLIMPKMYQLIELHELYSSDKIKDNLDVQIEFTRILIRHFLFSIRYLQRKRSIRYIWFVLKFLMLTNTMKLHFRKALKQFYI